ncbi:MAG TPA: hypothetical protein ENI68_08830 [Gammaproteobacteria bacterium]|nr:hypothetical protein [Gammaproteobacteria bacterium]
MSPNDRIEEMNVLKLTLHDRLVGYLAGFQNGRNVLSFADEFKGDPRSPHDITPQAAGNRTPGDLVALFHL